jgi:NtrC-family two-component system sensor histidine kinase KinB
MLTTLRNKLLLGLAPLLAIMLGLGVWAVAMFNDLGQRIDVILRENYHSVLAAEGMKEALERMDSAAQFALNCQDERGRKQFSENEPLFRANLEKERKNVTIGGEQELVDRLAANFDRYLAQSRVYFGLPAGQPGARSNHYDSTLYRTFLEIKRDADRILEINQSHMKSENDDARMAAARSSRVMILALLGAAVAATAIALVLSRSILEPIRAVTRAARAMTQGDLDQVVPATTRDELGELAMTFNTMARTIREFRQSRTARLLRAQKTAQATIDSIPDPVLVVDPTGAVERANPAACRILGVVNSEDGAMPWTPPPQLTLPLSDVLSGSTDHVANNLDRALCFRDRGQERFFLPRVLSIRGEQQATLGAAIVLSDVTKFRLVDQLKSDMVSTVSHELKTPLTGLQMVIHLMLEEVIGPLNAKQTELLLSARQDADRILAMINDLLDLTRIEQGRVDLDLQPTAPADLVREAIERYEPSAHDAGITLTGSVAFGLPPVCVDRERIAHVFDNLIGNALVHTERGGSVRLAVELDGVIMRFTIADTGEGIPREHLPRLFERFYRVPGSRNRGGGGAGLGLAIVREIVVSHGGDVTVSSELGSGTTFTFTLPAGIGVNVPADNNGAVSRPA